MELLVNTLCDLLHILKFIVLCDCFFLLEKRNTKLYQTSFILIGIVVSVFLFYEQNVDIKMIVYFLFLNVEISILYKEKIKRSVMICSGILFFVALLDKISAVFIQTIFCMLGVHSENTYVLLINSITLILIIIVGTILRHNNNTGINNIGKVYLVLFLILTIVDAAVLVYLGDLIIGMLQIERKISLGFVFILVVLGVFIQMAMVILLLMSRNVYKEKEALAAKYLKEQEAHYTYLERREKETKNFRHDLREHLHVLNVLCNNHNYNEFQEYLTTINGKIEEFGMKISVNNGFVDAILNKYAEEAEERNIKLKVSGHFPTDCKIEPYDLCTIVSNLLSNAIEAEYKWGGTEVEVFCRYTETEIILVIENDYDGDICYENGKLTTSKKDKINHGFGLENVEKSVNNNSGFMDITTENHKFKVSVIFEKG